MTKSSDRQLIFEKDRFEIIFIFRDILGVARRDAKPPSNAISVGKVNVNVECVFPLRFLYTHDFFLLKDGHVKLIKELKVEIHSLRSMLEVGDYSNIKKFAP